MSAPPKTPARPLSPHLSVYKLPLTAKLSITHRMTGVANYGAMVLVVWALIAAAGGPDAYGVASAILNSFLGKLILFGFTVSLYVHLCHGIRHLLWDIGIGFDAADADRNTLITVGAALALSVLTWIMAL